MCRHSLTNILLTFKPPFIMKCITIVGNLGSNAVMRTTSDGRQLMTFNVAVNQSNEQPLWFNCVGNMREKLFPYLLKGQCVLVIGDLSPALYKGQIDLTVNIDRVELCGKAPEPSSQQPTEEISKKVEVY